MSAASESLIERLKNKKSRSAFVRAHTRKLIAKQIRAMRNKEKYTQQEMESEFGIKQSWISDLENPNKPGMVNVQTLLKIADVFDVGLLVRFVPFDTFIEYSEKIYPEDLAVPSYDEENKAKLHTLKAEPWPLTVTIPVAIDASTATTIISQVGGGAALAFQGAARGTVPPEPMEMVK